MKGPRYVVVKTAIGRMEFEQLVEERIAKNARRIETCFDHLKLADGCPALLFMLMS